MAYSPATGELDHDELKRILENGGTITVDSSSGTTLVIVKDAQRKRFEERHAEFIKNLKDEMQRTKDLMFPPPPTPKPEPTAEELAALAEFRRTRHKLLRRKLANRK